MATQADIPEVVLHKTLEVEDTSLTTDQFEKSVGEYFPVEVKKYESKLIERPEIQECQAESENKEVACSIQVGVTNNVINGNPRTVEDESFLASPSDPTISNKEAGGQEGSQVDELDLSEVEISETAKHLEQGQRLEAVEETAREDEAVGEKNQRPDQVDQNVEMISSQQDSVDEGSRSSEKETKDVEKDERAGEVGDSLAELSNKEIPHVPEVNLDHKDVQSIAENYLKRENADNTSSTEATLLKKEDTEEKVSEETKEEDKSIDLVPEGKSSEAICSSENKGAEDEKNQMHGNTGDASLSTIALSHDESQNQETGESVKDEVERIQLADEPVDQEAGVTKKEKQELKSHEKDQTLDEVSAKENVEAESEGYQSTETTNVTLTEGIPPTEIILQESENSTEPVNNYGVSTKESLESRKDAGENESEEIKKEAEVTGIDVQKFTSSQESEDNSKLDDTPAMVENVVGEISKEEASKMTGDDESHKQESIVEDFNKEHISERDVAFSADETLNKEESIVEILKEGKINDLSLQNIQEGATETLKSHEHKAEKSKEEVLEELETAGAGDSIPSETNKDVESIVEASSVKQEGGQQGGTHLDRTEASIEESRVEIAEEEPLKSSGEDEGHTQENIEGNVNKEHIIERDVTFSRPASIQEEINKFSQDNIKDAENFNEEESIVEIKKEGKLDELSPENTVEDATIALEDRENEAENSKQEIREELDTTKAGEGIPCETNKDVKSSVEVSSVKQEVRNEDQDQDQDPVKGSIEESKVEIAEDKALKSKYEYEGRRQEKDSNKEQTIEDVTFSAVESIKEEATSKDNIRDAEELNEEKSTDQSIPKNNQEDETEKLNDQENEAEKCKEEVVQESESAGPSENISFEKNKDVEEFVEASSIKQEESQQAEGKYQEPIKASIEENEVETPNEDVPKLKGEDESHRQESTGADFDKEEFVEREATFSTPDSIQEETSERCQDTFKDGEKINEDTEITEEGDIHGLSSENVQEDTIEGLKDHENEVEKSKKEVVEDASSVKQEEEVQYLGPIGALVEKIKPEIPAEEDSKSRVHDESEQENAEADFENEGILEREVTFCTTESIQEEASKTSQDGIKDIESTTEIVKEGKINNLSQENIQEDTIKILKERESGVEKSKEEVVEEFEKDVAGESIPFETTKDDESSVDASSVKHVDIRQEEGKYIDPNGASAQSKEIEISEVEASKSRGEDEIPRKESKGEDFDREQIVGEEVLSTPESIREETSKSSQDNIKDFEKVNEETPVEITKEGSINDLSPEDTKEDATEVLKDHEDEVENSKEEVVQELGTAGQSKSIQYETNEDVESSAAASSVKQEESQQEEGKYLDQVEASIEANKFEDKFSIEVVKNDDENKATVTEVGAELPSKGEEDQEHKKKPEEKLEDSLHATQEETTTEKSSEIAQELTCIEAEGTIQNLNETSETEKEGDKSKNIDDTNDLEKEIPKEIETAGAGESSSVDALSVKQEERPQEEAKDIDQAEPSTEKEKIEETFTAEVVKDVEENKASEASSKGDESQKQATKMDETEKKLENYLHEKPEETNKEVPKELETAGADESGSCKISEDAESYVDASSVKQDESQQEDVKYIDQVEFSAEENKVEDTYSTEVVKEDDDSEVEVTEKQIEVESKDKEDQQEAMQKDEQGEKLEDLLHVTPEETETQPSSEIAREISCVEVEETVQKLDKTSETENEGEKPKSMDGANDSEKEIPKEIETAGAGAGLSVDVLSLRQEESQEEEVKDVDQAEASIDENKLEESFNTEVAKDDDENQVSDVASSGKEDQQQATKKDEPGDELENLLHVTPEETGTETSTENARNITCIEVEETAQNLEETAEIEHVEHVDGTKDSEKEIRQSLEAAGTVEQIERSGIKQEEDKELDQAEASKEENKVEDSSSTVVVKEDDENKVKVTEGEIEGDLQQVPQQDKPEEKLEDVVQVTPKETRAIQDVEETSKTETNEENTKNADNANSSVEEELETTSAGQEIREVVSREIGSLEEFSHKRTDTETIEETKEEVVEESSKEVEKAGRFKEEDKSSESKEQNEEVGLVEEIKSESLEYSAKLSEDSCTTTESPGEEKLAAEATQEKEPVVHHGPDSGPAGIPAEETSVKEAKPDDREEVKSYEVALEEKGLEDNQVQSESVLLTEIASEETGLKEAKPDHEEQIKSSDAASEEKDVSSSIVAGLESESVSTVILSEEAGLKEAELDDEEQVKTCDIAIEKKGLEMSVDVDVQSDFASTGIESEEPSSKEAELETVEQVKSYDSAPEEKGLASKKDTEVQYESVSTEILSAETSLKEADHNSEDQVKHSDLAPEEKSLPGSLDAELAKEAEADKEDDDNVKVTEGGIEEDLKPAPQQDKPEKKLEDVFQVTPKEIEMETSSGNVTCVEGEGAIQDVEETSETETKEENTKYVDNANGSVKEGLETTSAGQETREEVSREIGSLEEFSHKRTDTETTEETKEEVAEESSKEVEKKIEEEDKSSESKEQNEEVGLVEETKPESVEYSAKQNEDSFATVSTEAPGEEKLAAEATQEKEPVVHHGSDSGSAGILAEETSVKEAKPDDKDEFKRYEVALEEKGLEANQVQSASVVLTEITSEETGLKEAKPDYEERIKSSDAVSEEKGVSSSIDVGSESESVSTGILSEEAILKEAEPDDEEQVKTCNIAIEEKGLERSVDVDVQSDFSSTGIDSEEPSSKEAESETVEHVKNYDSAPEEKGLGSEKDTEVQSESVSTEILSAETSLKEAEQDSEDQVKHSDVASEEKSLPSTLDAELVKEAEADKEDDDNKVQVTEGEIEEDLQQAPQQNKPEEKPEDVLQVTPKETEKETSSGNVTCVEGEGAIQDLEETSETETKEENGSVKEGLETTSAGQETREEVSREIGSLAEFSHNRSDTEITVETKEVVEKSSKEVEKEEEKSSKSEEQNEEAGLIEEIKPGSLEDCAKPNEVETKEQAKEEIVEESSKEVEKVTEEDEPGEKLQEIETEKSSGNDTNITCVEREGTILDIEGTSEAENKEENTKNIDNANDSEKEVLETTSAGQETRDQVSREIGSPEEFSHKFTDTEETVEEIVAGSSKEVEKEGDQSYESKEQNKEAELIEELKPESLEEIAEPNEVETKEEIVEESSKEVEKEEDKSSESKDHNEEARAGLKEEIIPESLEDSAKPNEVEIKEEIVEESSKEVETKEEKVEESSKEVEKDEDKSSESKEQNEVADLVEEIKPESSEDKEKLNEDSCNTITTEAPEEEKLAAQETQEKEPIIHDDSDSGSVGILAEETCVKEAKPDDKEEDKSYEVALEEKVLEVNQVQSESVVLTEIVREETDSKEVKKEHEEKIESFDDALEKKGLERSVDPVATEIASEETCLKEAKPYDEEQNKSADAPSEEKGVPSGIDFGPESDSVSTGILSQEARLKEAEPEDEKQDETCDIAAEEKGPESRADVDVQYDFDSTRIESEETSSKEAESEIIESVKSYDAATEAKGLASNVIIEKQSDSASTEILSSETCVKEANQVHEDQAKDSDTAPEEKSSATSLETETVNEEVSLKEAEGDNEEHVQSGDFALEKEDLVSDTKVEVQSASVSAETTSEETAVKEVRRDHEEQVSSSDIAVEDKSLASSVDDTRVVSEETSLEEVQPDDEHIKDIAPEKESLVIREDTKVRYDSVSAGIVSEETTLKEDKPGNEDKVRSSEIAPEEESLVGEETGLKKAELDAKEEVESSYIASEEEVVASNVDVQQNEYARSEENEENKAPALTGEFEEKIEQIKAETPIAGSENKEHDTKAETSLEDSSSDNLQDSSTVPPQKDEPATTEESERLNEGIHKQRDVEITTKDAIPTEVQDVEKAVESESSHEQVAQREINLNESHPISTEDERVYEENDSCPILSEEGKIEDEVKKEVDSPYDNNDTRTVREETTVTNLGEAQPLETDSKERNLLLQKSECDILPAQKVETVTKLEERSFDLDQVDEKETEGKTVAEESSAVHEVKETKLTSDTEDIDATGPIPAVEELETVESKEEIKEASECQSVEAANEDEFIGEQAPDDGIWKGQEREAEATVETKEETIKEVDRQDNDKEEPSGPKLHEEAEERLRKEETEDVETAPEPLFESNYESIQAVSKNEVIADQDHHVGVSIEQVQELQTTEVVKKTEDPLVAEKPEEKNLKEESELEITEAPTTVISEEEALPAVASKDKLRVSHPEEQDSENASTCAVTKITEEENLLKEEPRAIKASDSLTDVLGSNETPEEIKGTSKTAFESDSQSIGVVAEDKNVICETFPEKPSEVQLLEQSYVVLPKEQDDGVTTRTKEIEEKITGETHSQKEVEDTTEASEVVSRDRYTDSAATDKKTEEEETKEEPKKIEVCEPKKIEPQESEGGTREAVIEASNLNIEKPSDLVAEKVESPEARTSIEEVEIIENHLKVATTDSRTEEPRCETTIQAEETTEREISDKEELSTVISEAKDVKEVIQEIKRTEESSYATCKESFETTITTIDKDAPPKLTDPVEEETSQAAEPKDVKPEKDTSMSREIIADVEIKKEEYEEEEETGGSKTETKPAVISLSELMQSAKEEAAGVAEHSTEAEKPKVDEEEEEEEDDEHEHEHEEAEHPDAPILVQASKDDTDHKGGRKKSHGIFSGVGSKVKHSISKVKKAITGKSSHSKTLPSS